MWCLTIRVRACDGIIIFWTAIIIDAKCLLAHNNVLGILMKKTSLSISYFSLFEIE